MVTTTSEDLAKSLARLEEWARHSEGISKKADDDRAEMMKQLAALSEGQKQLFLDMNKVKPVTDMITNIRYKMSGAAIVLGILGTILWAGVSFFKDALIKWLSS